LAGNSQLAKAQMASATAINPTAFPVSVEKTSFKFLNTPLITYHQVLGFSIIERNPAFSTCSFGQTLSAQAWLNLQRNYLKVS
jgi:hypothetical protein